MTLYSTTFMLTKLTDDDMTCLQNTTEYGDNLLNIFFDFKYQFMFPCPF